MALYKKINTGYGVDAEYWKITNVKIDWLTRDSSFLLKGYSSKEARDNMSLELDSYVFKFSRDKFDFEYTDNVVEKVYVKIKAIPYWSDAIDG